MTLRNGVELQGALVFFIEKDTAGASEVAGEVGGAFVEVSGAGRSFEGGRQFAESGIGSEIGELLGL